MHMYLFSNKQDGTPYLHYHGIIEALAETMPLQTKIDEVIPSWPLN